MYDYLIDDNFDTQVKCFYHPIFIPDEKVTYHSEGGLMTFRIGDVLPLKTYYYEYPKNCYIYLSSHLMVEDYSIAVVKDGKFDGFIKSIYDVEKMLPIINRNGIKLRISTKDDLIKFEKGLKKWKSAIKLVSYNSSEAEETFITKFKSKWFEEYTDEQQLGEFYHCLEMSISLYENNSRLLKDMIVLTELIEGYRVNKPDIFYSFLKKHNLKWAK